MVPNFRFWLLHLLHIKICQTVWHLSKTNQFHDFLIEIWPNYELPSHTWHGGLTWLKLSSAPLQQKGCHMVVIPIWNSKWTGTVTDTTKTCQFHNFLTKFFGRVLTFWPTLSCSAACDIVVLHDSNSRRRPCNKRVAIWWWSPFGTPNGLAPWKNNNGIWNECSLASLMAAAALTLFIVGSHKTCQME